MVDRYDVCPIMDQCDDGDWVRYEDHVTEVERLTAERDEAQAEYATAQADLATAHKVIAEMTETMSAALAERDKLTAELTAAREALGEAASSLEALTSAGARGNDYLHDLIDVRGYARRRARTAREALARLSTTTPLAEGGVTHDTPAPIADHRVCPSCAHGQDGECTRSYTDYCCGGCSSYEPIAEGGVTLEVPRV